MMPDEARKTALAHLGALANHKDIDAPAARRTPILSEAMSYYIKSSGSERYRRDTGYCFKHLSHLANQKIEDLKQEDFAKVHQKLSDTPVMANHVLSRVATAIDKLSDSLGIKLPNPAREIKPYQEKPRRRFLTDKEAPLIMDALRILAVHKRYAVQADAILMMIFTGQRKMNVLSMRWSEIRDGTWIIPEEKAKGGREIIVPLNSFALEVLGRRNTSEDYVFPARDKDTAKPHLQEVRRTMYHACKIAGIQDCHLHDLRRTLGSWMLMSGASIVEVSRTLGHSSIKVTESVYAHLLPEKISTATEKAIRAMTDKKYRQKIEKDKKNH